MVRLKMYSTDFTVLRSPSNIKNKNRNVNSIFKEPKRHSNPKSLYIKTENCSRIVSDLAG